MRTIARDSLLAIASQSDQLRQRSVGAPAARSLLLTVLGEYLLPTEESVWQETLVRSLELMGYSNQASRQALTRSTRNRWLETSREGRRSRMSLTQEMKQLLAEGAKRIYSFGETRNWDERWLVVVLRVPERQRSVRHQLRTQLAWAGFGSLGGGVWLTPHVEREAEINAAVKESAEAEMVSFIGRLGSLGEPRRVVADAWDLEEVRRSYSTFLRDFARARPSNPESVFVMHTLLIHAWRKMPYSDPQLPESLLPRGWPGARAHELFARRLETWQPQARNYFNEMNQTISNGRPAR